MEAPGSKIKPWLWALATLLIVGGIVAYGLWTLRQPAAITAEQVVATQPARVVTGRDYYAFVRLVELASKKSNGGNWDSGNDSAPDPYFRLYWRGTRIFESAARSDSLIATWDLARLDLKELVANQGKLDIASAINAPIVQIEPNESLRIEIWDDDPMGDDLALRLDVPLDSLYPGDNILTPDGAVKRVVIQMIDRQTPLEELIDLARRR